MSRYFHRRRDGTTVTLSYDFDRRLTSRSAPSTTYAYDNLSRLTSAVNGGGTLVPAYDALDRTTSETTYGYGLAYQYDLAGRRSRITWPDAFYVTYDYDLVDYMTAVKEAGSTTLAGFAYDNLGRRTSLTRLNGVTTRSLRRKPGHTLLSRQSWNPGASISKAITRIPDG